MRQGHSPKVRGSHHVGKASPLAGPVERRTTFTLPRFEREKKCYTKSRKNMAHETGKEPRCPKEMQPVPLWRGITAAPRRLRFQLVHSRRRVGTSQTNGKNRRRNPGATGGGPRPPGSAAASGDGVPQRGVRAPHTLPPWLPASRSPPSRGGAGGATRAPSSRPPALPGGPGGFSGAPASSPPPRRGDSPRGASCPPPRAAAARRRSSCGAPGQTPG